MKRPGVIDQMIQKLVLISLLFLFTGNIKSQSASIQKRIYLQHSKNAYSRDIIETTPGNFVLIGQSLDSNGTQTESRLTLVGLDNDGSVNWRKSYGNNKFTYTALIGSSRYIIKHKGFLYSAMPVIDSAGREPGVLIKFNFNGDTLWQKKYYQTNPTALSFFTSVTPSVDNGFLITGSIQTPTPGFNNHPTVGLYLLKTDINGNKLWDKTIYKSNLDLTQVGIDIVQDSASKRIVIVGSQDHNSSSTANVLILDSIGNILIQKGTTSDFFGSGLMNLIKTNDGNFLSSGLVEYPISNLLSNYRSFLVKFDTSCNIIFSLQYDSISYDNGISRIAELADGGIITGGYFEASNKYTNGLNTISRIMKHDRHGNLVWKKYFDNYTDNHNTDALLGMWLTSANDIVFTSFCECPEPAPLQFMFYRTDTNYCNINAVGCYSLTTGLKQFKNTTTNSFVLYPNPATNKCNIRFGLNYEYRLYRLEIRNMMGKLIFKDSAAITNDYELNLTDYIAGVYVVSLFFDDGYTLEQKLVIIK